MNRSRICTITTYRWLIPNAEMPSIIYNAIGTLFDPKLYDAVRWLQVAASSRKNEVAQLGLSVTEAPVPSGEAWVELP